MPWDRSEDEVSDDTEDVDDVPRDFWLLNEPGRVSLSFSSVVNDAAETCLSARVDASGQYLSRIYRMSVSEGSDKSFFNAAANLFISKGGRSTRRWW